MGTKDKRVDAYLSKSAVFARPILVHLRALVHSTVPGCEESIKWGFPFFSYKGTLCHMAAFKGHCAFGFWKSGLVAARVKEMPRLGANAMGQFGRIASLDDLPSDAVITRILKVAAKLNDDGVKKAAAPKDRVLTVPAYFRKAVNGNAKAKATFAAFPYSCRKEYVAWVTEAKTDATRDKRLATTVEWLAEGKRRNWKYEDC